MKLSINCNLIEHPLYSIDIEPTFNTEGMTDEEIEEQVLTENQDTIRALIDEIIYPSIQNETPR